jgi:hypothetical protein
MTATQRREYGNALSNMGFNYHNIIRYRSYDSNGKDKVYPNTLDRYMNKLIKRADISMAWACIEPDIDLQTGHKWGTNHVHFAYVGNKRLSHWQLSKSMGINREFLRDTQPIVRGMGYFTKHMGKDLLYHNLYA